MGYFFVKYENSIHELNNHCTNTLQRYGFSAQEEFTGNEDAYCKVWLTTAYTNMKMLKEILTVNECDIAGLLERTLLDRPGKKLRQMGIRFIPDDPKVLENTYQSMGGLCTAFTLRVIVESPLFPFT